MRPDQLFYAVQKAFIEHDGKILVLNDPVEGLDFPGGKIQEGETDFIESLRREVREETGLDIEVGDPFAVLPAGPHDGKMVYMVAFRCRYVSGEVSLSDEHDGFQWVDEGNYKAVDDGTDYFKVLEKYFQIR